MCWHGQTMAVLLVSLMLHKAWCVLCQLNICSILPFEGACHQVDQASPACHLLIYILSIMCRESEKETL